MDIYFMDNARQDEIETFYEVSKTPRSQKDFMHRFF